MIYFSGLARPPAILSTGNDIGRCGHLLLKLYASNDSAQYKSITRYLISISNDLDGRVRLTSSHDPPLRAMTPSGPPQVHRQPSHARHTLNQTQMCSGSQQGRTQYKKDGFRDADSHLCLGRAQPRDKPTPRRTRPLLPLHCRCRCDSSQRRLRLWHCCRRR